MSKERASDVKEPQTSEDVISGLWVSVFKKELSMREAETRLVDYVNSLPEEKREELRKKARPWAMWLMGVSEGFSQQLTVIAAG